MISPEVFTVTLEPLDVLVFRDYRGFDSGRMHENRSVGASPSVILGCLRSALLRSLGADFKSRDELFGVSLVWRPWLGDRRGPGSLQLRGPVYATGLRRERDLCPLIPAPLDRPWEQRRDLSELSSRFPSLAPQFSHPPLPRITWASGEAETKDPATEDDLLTAQGARAWQARGWHGVAVSEIVPLKQVVDTELRVGIARDLRTRTARTAMYYQQETLRFADDAGLLVEVDAETSEQTAQLLGLDQRIVPLGGRGHRALLRVERGAVLPAPPVHGGRVRAWCITPMVMGTHGICPRDGSLVAHLGGESIRLGSFDMANGRPRALQSALPAGTVLELENVKSPEQIDATSWGQPKDQAVAGFGTVILAGDPT